MFVYYFYPVLSMVIGYVQIWSVHTSLPGSTGFNFIEVTVEQGWKKPMFFKLEICFFSGFYGYGFFVFLGLSLESQK